MSWASLKEPLYPWVRSLNRILLAANVPAIGGRALAVYSDYSGESKATAYRVVALLCFGPEAAGGWEAARAAWRRRHLPDGRRMAYKRLGDRHRQNALIPFLAAAECIPGLCLAFIVSKKVRHLCFNDADYGRLRELAGLSARWSDEDLEGAALVTHLVSCVVGGLSTPNQDVTWISDEDALLANGARQRDVATLLSKWTSHYVEHPLGQLGLGTTKLDERDRRDEDCAAVPDLVAGALAEVTTSLSRATGGRVPSSVAVPYDEPLLDKADLVARWFWWGTGPLRRVAFAIDRAAGGRLQTARIDMLR
jgi:hypothetical protein